MLALFFLVSSLSTIFLPVLVAVILAYVLNPLVTILEKKGINRTLSVLVVFVLISIFCGGVALFFVSSIQNEFRNVQINLPEYVGRLYDLIPRQVKVYFDIETQEKLYLHINKGIEELRGMSFEIARNVLEFLKKAFASTLSFILTVIGYFIAPIYLYYFLKDLPELKEFILCSWPERFRGGAIEKAREIDDVLSAFVRGQLSVCAILAVLYSVGLFFIGIDLAIVIGTLAGMLFIIPYVGTIFGIVLSITMAFLKFHDVLHPVLCLGWFAIVQGVEGAIITPSIVGNKVGLHPIVAILALLIGGQWFGIFGMLLAVPTAAVLKVFLRSLHSWYLNSSYYKGI